MKKFTVALSPGHTPTAPGATRGNITEYGLSSAIIGDLIFRLDKAGHTAHLVGSDSNKNQVAQINKIAPDFGLELHFNSHTDKKVNGSMCLYYPKSKKGSLLASSVSHQIASSLKIKNKGAYFGNYELDPQKPVITIIKDTSCPFIVVEPLYLSNPSDFEKIDIPLISIAIFKGITEYWRTQNEH